MKRMTFVAGLCLLYATTAIAVSAPSSVVISEVQIAGATSKDEWVELFNPTGTSISLLDWKLTRKTAGGTESNLLSSFPDTTIPAYGFFLIGHPGKDGDPGYQGSVTPNAFYSAASQSLANDNTVLLYDDADALVDKVGMGGASDFETAPTVNPDDSKSIARKATLLPNGVNGPAQDTDHNADDFALQDVPTPQNSDVALPVTLLHSEAYWVTTGMRIEWRCEEKDMIHWHVYRTASETEPFQQVNAEPIRCNETGAYSYTDESAIRGQLYLYLVESVDASGNTSRSDVFSSTPLLIHNSTLTTMWATLKRR